MHLPIGWIPFIGEALEDLNLLIWVGLIAAAVLSRLPLPHARRACACAPSARTRWRPTRRASRRSGSATSRSIASGAFAALGGVFLSIGFVHSFNENMTVGKGFIGLAVVIVGKWKPGGAVAAALLFGFSSALAQRLAVTSPSIATLLQALPYVITLIAVAGVVGRSRPPAADGIPYERYSVGARWPSPDSASRARSPPASRCSARPQQVSDEVELYHRTYTTLLRSSGETLLRVLEPSHRSMTSSLHSLAGSEELDLGAFLYSIRRLPDEVASARVIVMGQEAEVFARHGIGPLDDWTPLEAPARRRRWYDDGNGTMAVLLASTSDLDDLIPTLVAFQIEWNKLRMRLRAVDWPRAGEEPTPAECAAALGGVEDDWVQLAEAWGERVRAAAGADGRRPAQHARAHARRLVGRLRADDAALVGAGPRLARRARARGPADVLRLLQPALDGQPAQRAPRAAASRRSRTGSSATARRTCAPSSRRSATAARTARGRTSSTSPPATSSRRSPRR